MLLQRFFSGAIAAFALLLFASTAYSAELLNAEDVNSAKSAFDHQQANLSEPICRNNLRTQLLAQQIAFSDSERPPEERRLAEDSIDHVREVFADTQSYCEASFALMEFLDKDLLEQSQTTKSGQIQSFDP